MSEYGSQAVVWQTAINPVVALELVASGAWTGTGILGPEAFPAQPYLDLITERGAPWDDGGDGPSLKRVSDEATALRGSRDQSLDIRLG